MILIWANTLFKLNFQTIVGLLATKSIFWLESVRLCQLNRRKLYKFVPRV